LEVLLSRREIRIEVWHQSTVISGLVTILKNKPTAQMAYQAALCFWLLSFDIDVAHQVNAKYDIVPLLLDIAQGAVKEKVIRVIIATFRVSSVPTVRHAAP